MEEEEEEEEEGEAREVKATVCLLQGRMVLGEERSMRLATSDR